jgi:hypothetical protein
MPNLPRKRATDEEVVNGLCLLVAEQAFGMVLQASPGESISGPTSIDVGEPMKEFDSVRCPTLPYELP